MSKQKQKLLTTTEKTPPEKPLVELTEAQLEAIGESQCAERNRRRRKFYRWMPPSSLHR